MAQRVEGDLYRDLDGQLWEIKRQIRQTNGYPFDAELLRDHLQAAIEGRFAGFFRETGEFAVKIPALRRPTLVELRKEFSWIKEKDGIVYDISPTKAVTLRLGTVLRPKEERIDGPEYERRRASLAGQFGYQQLKWLVDHQDEHPAFKALLGKIYIDGTGIIVVRVFGLRSFPCLDQVGTRWCLGWFEGGLRRDGRLAASGK